MPSHPSRPLPRRQVLAMLLAAVACTSAAAQQAPRRPGDGIPVSRPDSQGATRTWSSLPPAELVQVLRGGGYALLFRHGRTDWSTRDQLPQRSYDDRATQRNLSEEGIAQARRTGAVLRALGIRFDAVYSSPYFRTRDFAQLVSGQPAQVTRKLLGSDRIALEGHRELLSRIPAPGANTLLSGHQVAIVELGLMRLNELEEGSCLVVRPNGDPARLEVVAHLNHADLLALAELR